MHSNTLSLTFQTKYMFVSAQIRNFCFVIRVPNFKPKRRGKSGLPLTERISSAIYFNDLLRKH